MLPLFGIFTGWFTDWLALTMVFHPKHPTRYLDVVEWQGLLLKRRTEVAEKYGELIAREILTPANLFETLLQGPLSDRVFAMVQRHVQRTIGEQSGFARPLMVLSLGGSRSQEMKRFVSQRVMQELPTTVRHVERYAEEALDIRRTLVTKMGGLITVGAVLGGLMGEGRY